MEASSKLPPGAPFPWITYKKKIEELDSDEHHGEEEEEEEDDEDEENDDEDELVDENEQRWKHLKVLEPSAKKTKLFDMNSASDDEDGDYSSPEDGEDNEDEDDDEEEETSVLATSSFSEFAMTTSQQQQQQQQIGAEEINDLKPDALTILQPHDVKRIRTALKHHVQLLLQLLMAAASAKDEKIVTKCLGLIEDLVKQTDKNLLDSSIFKGIDVEAIRELLQEFHEENAKEFRPTEIPQWHQPIINRFTGILEKFGKQRFQKDWCILPKRKKVDEQGRTLSAWRKWHEPELHLLVMGLKKFGLHDKQQLGVSISRYLLPSRKPHIISRTLHKLSKNMLKSTFEIVNKWFAIGWFKAWKKSEMERLLYGARNYRNEQNGIDFVRIQRELLPHLTAQACLERYNYYKEEAE